jgi:N-acetylglutamate synthase-like GNAT family acetyltransferase
MHEGKSIGPLSLESDKADRVCKMFNQAEAAQNKDFDKDDVVIRPSTPEDSPAVGRLFQNHLNWIDFWFAHSVTTFRNAAPTAWCIEHFPGAVATIDETIVGFASCRLRDSRCADMVNVYVDDPYRKLGVATKMVELLNQQADELGITVMIGTATTRWFPGKPASERLFAKVGFEVIPLDVESSLYLRRVKNPGEPLVGDELTAAAANL